MNKRTIIFGLALLIIGVGFIVGYKYVTGWIAESGKTKASDAKVNLKIKVGFDDFAGYFLADSPEMERQSARQGVALSFTQDGGAYAERLEKFAKGEYDAILLPVAQYLVHGHKHNYPGVIVSSVSESRGADAILCFEDRIPSGKLELLNDASLKITYTKDSPSSFLVDLMIVDFNLYNLEKTDTWRQQVNSSSEAYERAKQRNGNCFVMWEPDISRALRDVPGLTVVWASDKFNDYIKDVFVFSRQFVKANPDGLLTTMDAYFQTMRVYSADRAKLLSDMKRWTKLSKDAEVETIIKKLDWHDLEENGATQFGITSIPGSVEGLVNTIVASSKVLVRTGQLPRDALGGDPYKILYSGVIQSLHARVGKAATAPVTRRTFRKLSDAERQSLRRVGAISVEQIFFPTGTSTVMRSEEEKIDKIAILLANNYPDARILVTGHTGKGGNETDNLAISKERAEAVVQRMIAVHNIDPERFMTDGKGSSEPAVKRPGESSRDYMSRIPRVEFVLFVENSL